MIPNEPLQKQKPMSISIYLCIYLWLYVKYLISYVFFFTLIVIEIYTDTSKKKQPTNQPTHAHINIIVYHKKTTKNRIYNIMNWKNIGQNIIIQNAINTTIHWWWWWWSYRSFLCKRFHHKKNTHNQNILTIPFHWIKYEHILYTLVRCDFHVFFAVWNSHIKFISFENDLFCVCVFDIFLFCVYFASTIKFIINQILCINSDVCNLK